ncbi:MAG: GGDEF domain-containing protein [Actinomycetota bacterium]|nr:GGDEF domain-containing protein [Actinomycetota bacterium]
MSTTGIRRAPISSRFRRVAAAVVENAAEHLADAGWVVARSDGNEHVVVAAAGVPDHVQPGTRLRLDPVRDLVLPLEVPDGSSVMVLCGLGAGEAHYDAAAVAKVLRLAAVLAEVAAAEDEAREQAARAEAEAQRARQAEEESLTESTTGLANRRAWDLALDTEERRSRRYGGTAAVVVIDLDDLKRVNDSQGHLHGDLLLRLAAQVIADTSRESDVVARTGGDEFAVLALNCDQPHLEVLVNRLRNALEAEGVSASVGGACRRPDSGMLEAWAEADDVMYAEKTRRKGGRGV